MNNIKSEEEEENEPSANSKVEEEKKLARIHSHASAHSYQTAQVSMCGHDTKWIESREIKIIIKNKTKQKEKRKRRIARWEKPSSKEREKRKYILLLYVLFISSY